jgi:hypothetical protein
MPYIHFVELKAPGKKPTKQQKEEHRKMQASGIYNVHTIDTEDKIDFFVMHRYIPHT